MVKAKKKTTPAFKARSIRVARGDVYTIGDGTYAVLVLRAEYRRAVCVRAGEAGAGWRRSYIQTKRLQREYARAGEVQAASMHRLYARHLSRAKKASKSC